MIIKFTILDSNSGLAHISGDVFAIGNKTIITITFIFPENLAIAIKISINGTRNLHLIKTNFIKIFFVVKKETTNSNNRNQKKNGSRFEEEEKTFF